MAVNTNLLRLGSINPKKNSHTLDAFIIKMGNNAVAIIYILKRSAKVQLGPDFSSILNMN